MKKQLPIGVSEFRDVRENGRYYVDKSLLIRELLSQGAAVTLITRPRRFGKTLNMTMLREFFDITKDSSALFKGLAIMDTAYAAEMNQWPVIYLSLRDCKGDKLDCLLCIMDVLLQAFDLLPDDMRLEESDGARLKRIHQVLLDQNIEQVAYLNRSIHFLSKLLYQHYGKKVIILIDEYDTPMINAYEQGYYDEVRFFFGTLYGSALKDNPYLERAMLTGIHRIAKESIFSGLNNLEVRTVLDRQYSQYFGLTPAETEVLLAYYDLPLNDAVKALYNGYTFGGQEVYAPWSIINYAKEKMLVPYWVHTASNHMVRQAIAEAGADYKRDLERLFQKGEVQVYVDMNTSFLEMRRSSTLWGLLLNTGYLTTQATPEDIFHGAIKVRIPNQEIRLAVFKEVLADYIQMEPVDMDWFRDTLLAKDAQGLQAAYNKFLLEHTSYFDSSEKGYHMLFLGLSFALAGHYHITSNIEHGHGRPDLLLEAKKPGLHHIIIEFKVGEDMEQLARQALAQIHEKQYYAGLSGEVLLLGIAHDKKTCAIADELLIMQNEAFRIKGR